MADTSAPQPTDPRDAEIATLRGLIREVLVASDIDAMRCGWSDWEARAGRAVGWKWDAPMNERRPSEMTPDGDVWKGLQAGTVDVVRQLERKNRRLRDALEGLVDDVENGWSDPSALRHAKEALTDA